MELRKKRIFWAIYFLLLVILAFAVPFVFLNQVAAFHGAFLFWCLFALAAIIGVAKITAHWPD